MHTHPTLLATVRVCRERVHLYESVSCKCTWVCVSVCMSVCLYVFVLLSEFVLSMHVGAVYICVYILVYMYGHVHVSVSVFIYMCGWVYLCVCLFLFCLCVHVEDGVNVSVCMSLCTSTCVDTCRCLCVWLCVCVSVFPCCASRLHLSPGLAFLCGYWLRWARPLLFRSCLARSAAVPVSPKRQSGLILGHLRDSSRSGEKRYLPSCSSERPAQDREWSSSSVISAVGNLLISPPSFFPIGLQWGRIGVQLLHFFTYMWQIKV